MKHLFKLISILLLIFPFCKTVISLPINQFINSLSPSINANSVNESSDINITFTQNMNAGTINNTNIKVFGYETGLLSASIIYNAVSKTATINPLNDFKTGEIISITLTSGLKTLTNEEITPFVFSFRVQTLGGTGIFTKASGIDNLSGASIKSGDIDGDGDVDLLVNNKIYKNNGNAVFSFYLTLSMAGIPELADFDNDGDLDILIENNSIIYFYQNNGSGNFIQTSTFAGKVGVFGDLHGDGYLDISYFVSISFISTLRNTGGLFIPDTTIQLFGSCLSSTGEYIDNLLIDDFDNDGDIDIIGISGNRGGFLFYRICRNFNRLSNYGDGRFNLLNIFSHTLESTTPFVLSFRDSKSFDFNNDGFVDIISPDRKLTNNGNATFSDVTSFGFSNSLVADFNGDGNIDQVSNALPTPLYTYINNGTGDFNRINGNNTNFASGIASGDFDNDGDVDVAIVDYDAQDVAILLNGDNPLPAEFSSFSSSVNSNTVNLSWTTTGEENNSGFEIERKTANEQWSKINFVEGAGNSNTPKNYSYDDRNLSSGKYKYRLKQIDFNGNYKYYELHNEVSIGIPGKFELLQNYPNPFNPNTKINYGIPSDGIVMIRIFDVNGKEVQTIVNGLKNAGYYSAEFNARDGQGSKLASGVYYYRIETENFVQTKKMLLIK